MTDRSETEDSGYVRNDSGYADISEGFVSVGVMGIVDVSV